MSKNSYAVLGLGSFGSTLAVELSKAGHTVLACDLNASRVDELRDKVAQVVIADVSSEETIKELNVGKFDAVILGMSSYLEKQILALTHLKQEGARRILAKARTAIQDRILTRLGADEVIRPEQDLARRLARRLSFSNITDLIEFKEGAWIGEVTVPEVLAGKTLKELDLRNRHQVTVLLLRRPGSTVENTPGPDVRLSKDDQLTVFGKRDSIIELFKER